MRKFYKKDKITVYAVETYCNSNLQDGTPWEYGQITIYYLDNKRKKVFEEYGMTFKDGVYSWPMSTSSRSIADLERKYYADYERHKNYLGDVKILVTKLGEL